MGWRDVLPVHPAAELLPLMAEDELKELARDIKNSGLRDRVLPLTEDGRLLDGRNRLDALELNGVDVVAAIASRKPSGQPVVFVTEAAEPFAFVLSRNVRRRHLTLEQKRDVTAKVLAARPEQSDRQIARAVGVSHPTVAKVRAEQEARTGKDYQFEKRIGADGKARRLPTPSPRPAPESDASAPALAEPPQRRPESAPTPPQSVGRIFRPEDLALVEKLIEPWRRLRVPEVTPQQRMQTLARIDVVIEHLQALRARIAAASRREPAKSPARRGLQ
jgi:hypothetical protein